MQFRGLDAQLAELTARAAQTARFNRTQYTRLDHARCGRGIREVQRRGGIHVLPIVAQFNDSQRCTRNGYRGVYACLERTAMVNPHENDRLVRRLRSAILRCGKTALGQQCRRDKMRHTAQAIS